MALQKGMITGKLKNHRLCLLLEEPAKEKAKPVLVVEQQKRVSCLFDATREEHFDGPDGQVGRFILNIVRELVFKTIILFASESIQGCSGGTESRSMVLLFLKLGCVLEGYLSKKKMV